MIHPQPSRSSELALGQAGSRNHSLKSAHRPAVKADDAAPLLEGWTSAYLQFTSAFWAITSVIFSPSTLITSLMLWLLAF